MIDGTIRLIKDIRPGDRVAPHGGMVKYVVKTRCREGKATMIRVSLVVDVATAYSIPFLLARRWSSDHSVASYSSSPTMDDAVFTGRCSHRGFL